MNKLLHGLALERALQDGLLRILQSVGWLKIAEISQPSKPPFDWLLSVRRHNDKTKLTLGVMAKTDLSPGKFMLADYGGNTMPPNIIPVLALPWVSPRMAEVCQRKGWNWIDAAGNYRLEIPGVILLQSTGHAAVHQRPKPAVNLGSAEAGNVIQTLLLSGRGCTWTQRDLQTQSAVSLGLVNKVVHYLRDEALVEFQPEHGIQLKEPTGLLHAWRDAYRFSRHQRLAYFTLLRGKNLTQALYQAGLDGGLAYASFSAAEALRVSYVRQPQTWLYVENSLLEKLVECTQAQPVETGDNLVVLVPDGAGVFIPGQQPETGLDEQRLTCTNPVRTYVDLWHSGGRGREAAEALFEQRIKPAWERKQLL